MQNSALSNERPININHHDIHHTNHHVFLAKKQGKSVKGKKSQAQPLPDDFSISAEMGKWAEENTPLVPPVSAIEDFIDWAISTGARSQNWEAAWRRFMRRRQEFAEQRADNRAEVKNAKSGKDDSKQRAKEADRASLRKLGY